MLEVYEAEPTLSERLIANQARIDLLMLEQSRLAAQFTRGSQWEYEGYNSAYDWIRFNCRVKGNVAMDYLIVGENLDRLEQTLEAMVNEEIGFAHVSSMADVANVAKEFDESELLPVAKETSPGKFYRKCLHCRHALDANRYKEDQERLFEERALRLSTAQDGCLLISGVLDPVGGAAVRSALEPLAKRSGTHDDRTREQRFADAFVDRVTAGQATNLQITATIETLKELAGAAAGEVEFSLPISAETVKRMACECSVTRVLLSQESLVMDVGRARRMIGTATRKALEVRDGACKWPGCERSTGFCDGHHIVHWADGGPTELPNLVLLCKRHHRMVHEGGWQLVKTEEGSIITVAPTVRFGPPPHSWGGAGAAGGGAGPD